VSRRWRRRTGRVLTGPLVIGLFVAGLAAGCTTQGSPPRPQPRAIRVASFDFPESELLAQLYGQALRAHGFPVVLMLGLGSREIVEPALQQGFVDLLPEYVGSALDFVTVGREPAVADVGPTHDLLLGALGTRGIAVLDSAPAENQNALAVTADTAAARGLQTISDLARVAPTLVFGGPPECPQRPFCLAGLQRTYGLRFKEFIPLDAGGPYTVDALRTGAVDVGLLFTTDGEVASNGFVLLGDDRGLQPAENVTPLLRQAVVTRYGPRVTQVVDSVSAVLTTGDLASMNRRVSVDAQPPSSVAARWLKEHHLVD
jgi:osmoprotectant transport system substrate-binding protein